MNWISSQSEQELRISMNKLGRRTWQSMRLQEAGPAPRVPRLPSYALITSSALPTLRDLSERLLESKHRLGLKLNNRALAWHAGPESDP